MKKSGTRRVFDLDLKLSLVSQIEKGELKVSEVCAVYGLSSTAVYKWLHKYSDIYQKQTRVIVERKSLSKKNQELRSRIEELERMVGQKQMRVEYLEAVLSSASKRLGEDIEKKEQTTVLEQFRINKAGRSFTMKALYQMIGISKQGHYQKVQRVNRKSILEGEVLARSREIRKEHQRMGCRKIYHLLNVEGMGRDKVEHLLLSNGFRVARKRNYTRTTYSTNYYYENHISGRKVTDINQLYVSDITYIPVSWKKHYYLTLVKDVYSRKIKGWQLSQTLRAEDTVVPAYQMAIQGLSNAVRRQLIFHSDKGSQYISHDMKALHQRNGTIPSMGGKAWENAHAESLNGILKNEYLDILGRNLSLKQVRNLVAQVIKKYNTQRPHGSLKNMKPEEFETFLLGRAPKERPTVIINY